MYFVKILHTNINNEGDDNLMVKYWSSKPTSGVRFPLISMNSRLFIINKSIVTSILSIIIISLLFLMNDFFIGNNFGQRLLLASALGFTLY